MASTSSTVLLIDVDLAPAETEAVGANAEAAVSMVARMANFMVVVVLDKLIIIIIHGFRDFLLPPAHSNDQ